MLVRDSVIWYPCDPPVHGGGAPVRIDAGPTTAKGHPMPFLRSAALAAIALLAVTAAGSPLLAQTAAPAAEKAADLDPAKMVVAKVGDGEVTLADLIAMREDLPPQYRQMPLQTIYPALLERAIDGRLIANTARAADLAKREDVARRIRRAEDQVLSQVYLTETIAAQVTEDALRERYKTFAAEQSGREEAHASHILLDTEDQAKAVIADLDKGGDFAALAKERSTDPAGAEGGDLGWFSAEQMVPEFSQAAFALTPGTYSKEPVKSQFGWHVIKLVEKRTTEAPAFEQVRDQLASELSRELITAKLDTLRAGVKIERFGPDGTPIPAPQ
ncbi:hypothetical protein BAL199_18098 [alpha proteobacterium BAL199]|jgi:peptidyl-prolyl cis-trans isomerase C|nr:hypothetical protein BAL199_18098 [alpha proteobacterium BAL199]